MSLDISLSSNEHEYLSMNWLRNPYGLCNWAEDNLQYIEKKPEEYENTLHYVCNNWNYEKSKDIDREKFLRVVMYYWEFIRELKIAYYFFGFSAYRQFVESNYHLIPKEETILGEDIKGKVLLGRYDKLGINVEYFKHSAFNLGFRGCKSMLERNQNWFKELVEFAEALQDKETEFYCSN